MFVIGLCVCVSGSFGRGVHNMFLVNIYNIGFLYLLGKLGCTCSVFWVRLWFLTHFNHNTSLNCDLVSKTLALYFNAFFAHIICLYIYRFRGLKRTLHVCVYDRSYISESLCTVCSLYYYVIDSVSFIGPMRCW